MPHLELNREGWIKLANIYPMRSIDDLAEAAGLDVEDVRCVFNGDCYPDAEFVAACLGALPATFNDLFVVTIPAQAVA